eukprot:SAG11_NODE_3120_length_2672_cov_1.911776_5_plen_49_part_01
MRRGKLQNAPKLAGLKWFGPCSIHTQHINAKTKPKPSRTTKETHTNKEA